MKLALDVPNEKTRLTVSIDCEVADHLEAYQRLLKSKTRSAATMSIIVEKMLAHFMASDRDFQVALKNGEHLTITDDDADTSDDLDDDADDDNSSPASAFSTSL